MLVPSGISSRSISVMIWSISSGQTMAFLSPQRSKSDFGLFLCDKILQQAGKSLVLILDMPQVVGQWEQITGNHLIAQQRAYDHHAEREMAEEYLAKLNAGQRDAYDKILASVMNKEGKLFFLHGPGGCGKSFLWNTLGHTVRGQQLIVLCIASSLSYAL